MASVRGTKDIPYPSALCGSYNRVSAYGKRIRRYKRTGAVRIHGHAHIHRAVRCFMHRFGSDKKTPRQIKNLGFTAICSYVFTNLSVPYGTERFFIMQPHTSVRNALRSGMICQKSILCSREKREQGMLFICSKTRIVRRTVRRKAIRDQNTGHMPSRKEKLCRQRLRHKAS